MEGEQGIILIEEHSRLKALQYSILPKTVCFGGKVFAAKRETIGDYDYLRNQDEELVGFSINISSRERKLLSSLAITCAHIQIEERQVKFLLGSAPTKEDGVQIPTQIYRSNTGEILIAFYRWGNLGKLGFSLCST